MAKAGGPTKWYERDATPGYALIGASALSFILLNGPTREAFDAFLHFHVDWSVLGYEFSYDVKKFVKDALMAVFFLYVGLELKREVVEGPFRNPREAALPALGAIGGMLAPALIYFLVATVLHPAADPEFARGWAIPTATDIAFAVGVLSLIGNRVPGGVRLFLLALAIADDLGAILVIALFYSTGLQPLPIVIAALIFGGMLLMNRGGVRSLWPYWLAGVALWFTMAKTGSSPTLAGVLTAVAVPMRRPDGGSPLIDAEHALKLPVQLGIMPIFALVVAGVPMAGQSVAGLLHPVTVGIAMGLFLGKPLGIVTLTLIGARLLNQRTPCGVGGLIGMSLVAGIGFTMSLFVGALAFPEAVYPEISAPVRFGVLGGSLIAASAGLAILLKVYAKAAPPRATDLSREEELAEERGVLENIDAPNGARAKDRNGGGSR
jgi:Na+:H+ antiporter, NhaA family